MNVWGGKDELKRAGLASMSKWKIRHQRSNGSFLLCQSASHHGCMMRRLKRIFENALTWAMTEVDLGHFRLCKHDALLCQERCSWNQMSNVSSYVWLRNPTSSVTMGRREEWMTDQNGSHYSRFNSRILLGPDRLTITLKWHDAYQQMQQCSILMLVSQQNLAMISSKYV